MVHIFKQKAMSDRQNLPIITVSVFITGVFCNQEECFL